MKYLKVILTVWGGLSAFAMFIAVIYMGYYFTWGNTNKQNTAKNDDVRFVLNWSELGESRMESVVHSFQSARSLTGDHLDAYAIKITNITQHELTEPRTDDVKWTRGDNIEGALKAAVDLAYSFAQLNQLTWFPDNRRLLSPAFYVYAWTILLHGDRVTAAELIFVSASDKMVYYASVKI